MMLLYTISGLKKKRIIKYKGKKKKSISVFRAFEHGKKKGARKDEPDDLFIKVETFRHQQLVFLPVQLLSSVIKETTTIIRIRMMQLI
jgi:hypothetical protein